MAKKQKLNLIEELTTHKCDYQIWPLQPSQPKTDFRARETQPPTTPPPYRYIDAQSHAPYIPSVYVPFDLYVRPKPIVGTHPLECFDHKNTSKLGGDRKYTKLPTLLSPTLPLTEVKDERILDVILNYTYTGMHKVLMEEAALKIPERVNPFNRVTAEGNDLRYKPTLYAPLPPGWITAARHWDCLQSRYLGDPFKSFWTRRGPEVECSCCCNALPDMLPKETKEEIKNLICEDKLNLAYDVTKTGYGGYKPIVAKGVPLAKH